MDFARHCRGHHRRTVRRRHRADEEQQIRHLDHRGRRRQSSSVQAAPQPSGTQPPAQTNNASPSMTCEGYTANVDEGSQPGWHATINHFGLAYAVPPDWNVGACGVRMGWAQPCPEGQCVIREDRRGRHDRQPCVPQAESRDGRRHQIEESGHQGRAGRGIEDGTGHLLRERAAQPPKVDFTPVRDFTIGTHPAVQIGRDGRAA